MSDATATMIVSRLAVASLEFLLVGALAGALLALIPGISFRWRRFIWLFVMCKPLVTMVTTFMAGILPVPSTVCGRFLGDMLFPEPGSPTPFPQEDPYGKVFVLIVYAWIFVAGYFLVRVWRRAQEDRELVNDSLAKGYLLKPSKLKWLDPNLEHIPSEVRIIATPEDVGPVAVGVFKPAVIISETLLPWVTKHRDPTPEERAQFCQILRHELAHVQNQDALLSVIAMVMRSLFWFHPIAHWGYYRVRMNNELSCDEEVVNGGINALDYMGTLSRMVRCKSAARGHASSILGDATAAHRVLKRRVINLGRLSCGSAALTATHRGAAYATLAILALTMPRYMPTAPTGYVDVRILATNEIIRIAEEDLPQYPPSMAEIVTRGVYHRRYLEMAESGEMNTAPEPAATDVPGTSMMDQLYRFVSDDSNVVGPPQAEEAPVIDAGEEDVMVARPDGDPVQPDSESETTPEKKKESKPKSRGHSGPPGVRIEGGGSQPVLPVR